jgi:flagellar protein FliL
MNGKKTFVYIIVSVLLTTIIVSAGLFLYIKQPFAASPEEKLIENSIGTEEFTTNLADEGLIRVRFQIQLDSKEAKEELEKKIFQLENAIIYELAGMTQKDIHGQEGMTLIENSIAKKIDEFLKKGEVVRVFTTKKIIQ